MSDDPQTPQPAQGSAPGIRKLTPYWHPYTTMAKERWLGREILEVVSTEFRDRSMEYYRYALESGVTSINGKSAKPDTIIKNGDRIENVVHRHEPPISSTPVKIILHDKERGFLVINKPGSIPVHATGRYYHHSLVQILRNDFGFDRVYTINRLDRLTSGLMIVPLNADLARSLSAEFVNGSVRKEYIARCKGEFPVGEVVLEEPLLTVDRQMGLNIVHPQGKPAKTAFNRIHYDSNTHTSVVRCTVFSFLFSHQIRVHLQYLGHPIANDPIYSEERIWGPNLGEGGVDIVPSVERAAPAPPPHLRSEYIPELLRAGTDDGGLGNHGRQLLPRETGHDIGMGSPVPLSSEAVQVITRLRNMKGRSDEDEDWSRWRDVVFRAKGALTPRTFRIPPLPPQNRRKRGGEASRSSRSRSHTKVSPPGVAEDATSGPAVDPDTGTLYCPECYLPLHPDPRPEKLYIFLHAFKYTTSLGSFQTEIPEWALEGWEWT
ncbi:hypothetical protein M404DRAFT_129971 [Pisolithus tinctorius Marx 270]|uniref:Pseudouridine synthase n=1 Tax=Pisolithus tinctorius Marx 270 TaxID=870435 RepID=A0A0C3PN25_PISTI|nr:hypothetical protein M404DRAFT_129971 [Pisolithus tinctorius Marx 270]